MATLLAQVAGIGWWAPGVPDWPSAAHLLSADLPWPTDGAPTPAARRLAPNERRRAPLAVRIACEVAGQACSMAGQDPAALPCVYASMHGDLDITDDLCTTLADHPLELSPTRFHNSVLNAAVGYWTIATGCQAASTALSAWHGSLASGLLEAASECLAEQRPVLMVACDIDGGGALARVLPTSMAHGLALVLVPPGAAATGVTLRVRHASGAALPAPAEPIALPRQLLAALACGVTREIALPAGAAARLDVTVSP